MVVVCKLRCREEFVPVILLVASEKPDELFELLVDALGLAVSLWVVSRGGRRSNSGEPPKLPCEVRTSGYL